MWRKLMGVAVAVLMIAVGGVWTAQANGWVGDAEPSQAMATIGSLLAGLGVALVFVVLQRRQQR